MRVSEHYKLGRTQASLDFVDVDIRDDTPVFIDPRAVKEVRSDWADECVALIQDFFRVIISLIQSDEDVKARSLLRSLREPNETHLGFSKGRSRGRALGRESAHGVWEALSRSRAAQSGLLEDLEDTILLVPGVNTDIVSDITTNIIREPLVRYTQVMADFYGIATKEGVDSGPLWDPAKSRWYNEFVRLPVVPSGRLLLVPKVIVRTDMEYDADEYYRHYILESLREAELRAGSDLVQLLRDGTRRVTKKDLEAKYGRGKDVNLRETLTHPELLQRYRDDKRLDVKPPLDHREIAAAEGTAAPDWKKLLEDVVAIPAGNEYATEYEMRIEALLTALFYPALTFPTKQASLHSGRKRVDISYVNSARSGFFGWISQHYPAAKVFVECKNYSSDPTNPELDQLSGRFSPSRGRFGLLVCRRIKDKELFLARCRDTARDDRGFIVPLDDEDLAELVDEIAITQPPLYALMTARFDRLIM